MHFMALFLKISFKIWLKSCLFLLGIQKFANKAWIRQIRQELQMPHDDALFGVLALFVFFSENFLVVLSGVTTAVYCKWSFALNAVNGRNSLIYNFQKEIAGPPRANCRTYLSFRSPWQVWPFISYILGIIRSSHFGWSVCFRYSSGGLLWSRNRKTDMTVTDWNHKKEWLIKLGFYVCLLLKDFHRHKLWPYENLHYFDE